MIFYFFRHGETVWNQQKRIQGHNDIPLNETGRRQAEELIPKLANVGMEWIYASDLRRAGETAELAAPEGIGISYHPQLREYHLGEAEGFTIDQLKIKFGEQLCDDWFSLTKVNDQLSLPGGESHQQLRDRILGFLKKCIAENTYQTVGIATHGGVIKRVLKSLLPEDHPPLQIPNCVVYKVTSDGMTWQIEGPI
jgi:broad specificity phosphatase PhoE